MRPEIHTTDDRRVTERYLARLERLDHAWGLRRSAEEVMSLNELSRLRE